MDHTTAARSVEDRVTIFFPSGLHAAARRSSRRPAKTTVGAAPSTDHTYTLPSLEAVRICLPSGLQDASMSPRWNVSTVKSGGSAESADHTHTLPSLEAVRICLPSGLHAALTSASLGASWA